MVFFFFFQAEDGIRDGTVTGVQTCALPISIRAVRSVARLTPCGQVVCAYPRPRQGRLRRPGFRPARGSGRRRDLVALPPEAFYGARHDLHRFAWITPRTWCIAGHWAQASLSARSPTPVAFATTLISRENFAIGSAVHPVPTAPHDRRADNATVRAGTGERAPLAHAVWPLVV